MWKGLGACVCVDGDWLLVVVVGVLLVEGGEVWLGVWCVCVVRTGGVDVLLIW